MAVEIFLYPRILIKKDEITVLKSNAWMPLKNYFRETTEFIFSKILSFPSLNQVYGYPDPGNVDLGVIISSVRFLFGADGPTVFIRWFHRLHDCQTILFNYGLKLPRKYGANDISPGVEPWLWERKPCTLLSHLKMRSLSLWRPRWTKMTKRN